MLIVVLALCLGTALFVALRRRDPISLYLLGMSVANCVMLTGVIIYIAKMGGLAATQKTFLFLLPQLQRWLQNLAIPLDRLGYVVALGRTLFPLLAVLLALDTTMIPFLRRHLRVFRLAACVPALVFLVYYFPPVFRALTRGRLLLMTGMMPVSLALILAYLVAATVLVFIEYRSTTISFCRKSFGYVLISLVGLEALYFLYATKDPAQIYNMYVIEYLQMGVATYIGPGLSGLAWAVLGLCTVLFVGLGSYGMMRYTQLSYDETRQDLSLQRKFDTAGTGISVFVHGIKNQLLSSRVLQKKLNRALDAADLDAARGAAEQLESLNEGMLTRMDELYRAVKTNALTLSPVPAMEVARSAVERFRGKYPYAKLPVIGETCRLVLADLPHLAEALYNLLTNGYEAAIARQRDPEIALYIREERLWTVLEVRDNGGGISQEQRGKIFDPFYTSKNTNHNWGMGLYYVRKIVKSHFGTLRLESAEGEGSSFFVMLPLYDTGR